MRPEEGGWPGFMAQIVDHIAHPVFVKDRAFRFVYVNRALCQLVGFPREQLIGKTACDFFPRAEADCFRQKDTETFATAREVESVEEPITDASGKHHLLATTKVPLREASGEVTHLVGIIHDITALKSAEEALRGANEGLERRVAERSRELAVAQQQLLREERLAVLGRLVGGLAHQIRNPLGAIANAAAILHKVIGPAANPQAAAAIAVITEEVWRANRIIVDLIDFARIRPPAPRRIEVDAALACHQCPPHLALKLDIPRPLEVPVDRDRHLLDGAGQGDPLRGAAARVASGRLPAGRRRSTSGPVELTLRQLNRATLARQLLLTREKTSVPKALERLVAMQAQLPRPPFVGLWSRVARFERTQLARLLERREVVRATLLRGTLHLLTARDFVAFRAILSPMLERSIAAVLRERAKGLEVRHLAAQATSLLEEGPRTFEEVREQLLRFNPKGDARAMGYAVRCALPLVQVPTDAPWSFPTDSQFALASAWLGKPPGTDPDPRPLVLRYLAAFGPASVADMQAWSGLRELEAAFDALRPKLKAFLDPRGRELFDLPKAPRPEAETPAPVRLLPDFDNLVLGHADRSRVIADEHRALIATKNLQILPTFLVDGVVAGTWRLDRAKASATLTLRPFELLPKKAREELTAEASALAKFVEPEAARQQVLFA